MVRLVLAGPLAVIAAALSADAQDAPGRAAEAGRYTLSASEGGFIRLDTRTGAVSHCSKADGVWHCETTSEPAAAASPDPVLADLGTRLEGLAAEVAALSLAVADLRGAVAAIEATTPDISRTPPARRSFGEEAVVRFYRMVAGMKRGAVATD